MGSWERVGVVAVGGLTDVGFADEHLLLVIGHQGRGLVDCWTAERVARDPLDDWSYFDDQAGTAVGIGPAAGQVVQVAGFMSERSLPDRAGGWRVSQHDGQLRVESESGQSELVRVDEEVRVFGFNGDGTTLVVGTSSDIAIYSRTTGT